MKTRPALSRREIVRDLVLLALFLAALALVAFAPLVLAQDDRAALLLARTCVSERGWRIYTNDCAAIYEVAHGRALRETTSLASAIRALSPRLHGDPCSVSRSWLCDLDEDGHRPEGLRVPWERRLSYTGDRSRREAWAFTLDEARDLVTGNVPPVCVEEPRAWGSDADVRAIIRNGGRFDAIDCGPTVNTFGRRYRRR